MRICDTQIGTAMLDTARKQLSLIAIFHIVGYKHCLKTSLLRTTEEVCGTTRPHRWHRETWWWNEHVGEVITAKRQAFKAWKTCKALEHHTMQPNALPDLQCIMLAKKLTRGSTRILAQSLQNYTALQTSLEKGMPML